MLVSCLPDKLSKGYFPLHTLMADTQQKQGFYLFSLEKYSYKLRKNWQFSKVTQISHFPSQEDFVYDRSIILKDGFNDHFHYYISSLSMPRDDYSG
jgi:ethanolamine ammonia-lyase large subunit